MHRNVIHAVSVLAFSIAFAGHVTISQAHEADTRCNVLLDGDGEPIRAGDSNVIDHANSHDCKSDVSKSDNYDAAAVPEKVVAKPVSIEPLTVFFDVNQDQLSAASSAKVLAFAKKLNASAPEKVEIVGHADSSGSAALNEQLSKARAASVKETLLQAGVSAEIISIDASGEESLAIKTPDGTKEKDNRRVTITPTY